MPAEITQSNHYLTNQLSFNRALDQGQRLLGIVPVLAFLGALGCALGAHNFLNRLNCDFHSAFSLEDILYLSGLGLMTLLPPTLLIAAVSLILLIVLWGVCAVAQKLTMGRSEKGWHVGPLFTSYIIFMLMYFLYFVTIFVTPNEISDVINKKFLHFDIAGIANNLIYSGFGSNYHDYGINFPLFYIIRGPSIIFALMLFIFGAWLSFLIISSRIKNFGTEAEINSLYNSARMAQNFSLVIISIIVIYIPYQGAQYYLSMRNFLMNTEHNSECGDAVASTLLWAGEKSVIVSCLYKSGKNTAVTTYDPENYPEAFNPDNR